MLTIPEHPSKAVRPGPFVWNVVTLVAEISILVISVFLQKYGQL